MVTYYKIGDMFCASAHGDLPYEKTEKPAAGTTLTWLFTGEPGSRRASFLVNHPAELFAECEDVSWLNTNRLNASAYDGQTRELPADLLAQLDAGTLRAVNASHPKFEEILAYKPKEGKKRVHVLAIGDVGSMLLTGLHLLGGDVISSIGICDISDKVTARWEFEENQIAYPWDYDAMPEVDVVDQDHLFDCDVFVFVASKLISPWGAAGLGCHTRGFSSRLGRGAGRRSPPLPLRSPCGWRGARSGAGWVRLMDKAILPSGAMESTLTETVCPSLNTAERSCTNS